MVVRPGRLNLGIFSPVVYIPIDVVRSLSMERVVVDTGDVWMPAEWKQRPSR
jgi:hypothetical protein